MTNHEYFGNHSLGEELTNSIRASHKFIEDTIAHPDRRARQVAAAIDGIVVGGIKAIPDRIVNHPQETLTTAAGGLVLGGVIGAAAAVESPLVAAGIAIGATAMTCKYVFDLGTRLSNDKQLTIAFDNIWHSGGSAKLYKSLPVVEDRLGRETFDLALLGSTGGYGFKGGSALMKGGLRPPTPLAFAESAANGAARQKPVSTEGIKDMQTTLAMERWRDRSGNVRYDRRSPEFFANLIDQPLSKRLDHLEQLIKSGKAGEAYEFVNANLAWYDSRRSSYGSEHYEISQGFWKVGVNLSSVVHEGAGGLSSKALMVIKELRQNHCHGNSDWPLKVSSEKVDCPDRILALTDKQRVSEIDKLFQAGYIKDASTIANWGYVLHRDAKNPLLEKKYDLALYELGKIRLRDPEASSMVCQERLVDLKKAVGLF